MCRTPSTVEPSASRFDRIDAALATVADSSRGHCFFAWQRTLSMADDNRYQADEQRWAGWMAAAHDGDKIAYERLLSELADVIEAYVRRRFGPLPNLEDCVQESLIAVHRARRTYDPARPFRPWLFTLVRHKTIDLLRRNQRHDVATGSDVALIEEAARESLNDLIDGIRVLQRITPDHRNAVALTQYGGYTVPEAARELGISESALNFQSRLRSPRCCPSGCPAL